MRLFKKCSQKKSFLTTTNVENNMKHLKVLLKILPVHVCTIYNFLHFPWEIVFRVISANYLYL